MPSQPGMVLPNFFRRKAALFFHGTMEGEGETFFQMYSAHKVADYPVKRNCRGSASPGNADQSSEFSFDGRILW